MAELNVQPKKRSSIWWIILVAVVLIILFTIYRGCNGTKTTSDHVEKDTIGTT